MQGLFEAFKTAMDPLEEEKYTYADIIICQEKSNMMYVELILLFSFLLLFSLSENECTNIYVHHQVPSPNIFAWCVYPSCIDHQCDYFYHYEVM